MSRFESQSILRTPKYIATHPNGSSGKSLNVTPPPIDLTIKTKRGLDFHEILHDFIYKIPYFFLNPRTRANVDSTLNFLCRKVFTHEYIDGLYEGTHDPLIASISFLQFSSPIYNISIVLIFYLSK